MGRYAEIPWHTLTVDEVEQALKTDRYAGLSRKVARARKERLGGNRLFSSPPPTISSCLRAVIGDASLLMLTAVALIGCCFSLWEISIPVLLILTVNCTLTVVAYWKACQVRRAAEHYGIPRCEVIRAGRRTYARADQLLPGDLLCLHRGDVVGADARLVTCFHDFAVSTLREMRDGSPHYCDDYRKHAEAQYTESDAPEALARENMLYAGSRVTAGQALALVVAIGEDTYHGALGGAYALRVSGGELPCLTRLRKYGDRSALITCAMLLPAMLVGLLAGEQIGLFELFLATLSLAVGAMREVPVIVGRIVVACGVVRAALPAKREGAAVFRKCTSIGEIGRMSEVFFSDMDALTDGCQHPYAVYTDGALFREEGLLSPTVVRFYSLAYLYGKAAEQMGGVVDAADDTRSALLQGVREMTELLALDTESWEIRTTSAVGAPDGSGDALVTLRLKNGGAADLRIVCSQHEQLLSVCDAIALGEEAVPMDQTKLEAVRMAVAQLLRQGCRLLFYATRDADRTTFEGIIALREAVDGALHDQLTELSAHGVRATVMLPSVDARECAVLQSGGLLASEKDVIDAAGMSDEQLYRTYMRRGRTVYSGVDAARLATLIGRRREEGAICGAVALRSRELSVLEAADVRVSCDDTPYRSDGGSADVVARNLTPRELADRRRECGDAALTCMSDLLLRRGGVLKGLLRAVRCSRSVEKNIALLLRYLQTVRTLRMTLLLLPLFLAKLSVTATLLLLSGIWVDLGYGILLAFRRGGEERSLRTDTHGTDVAESRLHRWAAVLTALVTLLLSLLLGSTGEGAVEMQRTLYVFVSLLWIQTASMLQLYLSDLPAKGRVRRAGIPAVSVLAAVLIPLLILLVIPGVATALGCAVLTLPTLLKTLVPPACYFLLYRVLSSVLPRGRAVSK